MNDDAHVYTGGSSPVPEAERKLAAAGEIVITRDAKPVARLLDSGCHLDELVFCPASIVEVAEAQTRSLAKSAHCRTLDRLHLATMQVLGLQRLLTNDDCQAAAVPRPRLRRAPAAPTACAPCGGRALDIGGAA